MFMSIAPSRAPSIDHPHKPHAVRTLRQRWLSPFLLAALPLALVACGKPAQQAGAPGGAMPPPEVSVVTVTAQDHAIDLE
jgi:membrane fusion protein (multidrug efflux system)